MQQVIKSIHYKYQTQKYRTIEQINIHAKLIIYDNQMQSQIESKGENIV